MEVPAVSGSTGCCGDAAQVVTQLPVTPEPGAEPAGAESIKPKPAVARHVSETRRNVVISGVSIYSLCCIGMLRIMQLVGGPAAPEIADEGYGGEQTALLHGQLRLLVGQLGLLRQSHRGVIDRTGFEFR